MADEGARRDGDRAPRREAAAAPVEAAQVDAAHNGYDERFDECFAIWQPWRPPGPVAGPQEPPRQ